MEPVKGKIDNLIFFWSLLYFTPMSWCLPEGFLGKAFGSELEFPWSWAPHVGALSFVFYLDYSCRFGIFLSLKPFVQFKMKEGRFSKFDFHL